MGSRYATEGIVNLKNMAEEIGQKYGENAKTEFEAGICLAIPAMNLLLCYL